MKSPSVAGVVLAGGKSSRLGQDKAMLIVATSRKPQLEHTVYLLEHFFSPVLVSGRVVSYTCSFSDLLPHRGPMGGIVAAMHHVQGQACCVLSCDMPCMHFDIIQKLVTAREKRKPGTLVTWYASKGLLHPLVAIYEPEALSVLTASLAQGNFSLGRSIPYYLQQRIECPQDDIRAFFNLNTLADYRLMLSEGVLLRKEHMG